MNSKFNVLQKIKIYFCRYENNDKNIKFCVKMYYLNDAMLMINLQYYRFITPCRRELTVLHNRDKITEKELSQQHTIFNDPIIL